MSLDIKSVLKSYSSLSSRAHMTLSSSIISLCMCKFYKYLMSTLRIIQCSFETHRITISIQTWQTLVDFSYYSFAQLMLLFYLTRPWCIARSVER